MLVDDDDDDAEVVCETRNLSSKRQHSQSASCLASSPGSAWVA